MGQNPTLDDFDPAARKLLAGLNRHAISMLAINARHEQDEIDRADWPTDPKGAAQAVREVLRRKRTVSVEDGLYEIAQSLRLANLILDRGEDLDQIDQEALHWLLGRTEDIVMHEKALNDEASERLRHALLPQLR